jgi:uncharacterized protein YidB (DUF937 family)
MGVLGNQQLGGLSGLVKQFAGQGLGNIVNSWVGTGANLPISSDQVKKGLGANLINELASKSGLSADDVTSHLTKLLPQVVDKLTPNGTIPQGDLATQGVNILKSILG